MPVRTRLFVLVVSVPLVAFVLVGGFLGKAAAGDGGYRDLRVFEDVVSLILNNYVEQVEVDSVMEGALRGLAEGLDPDSAYLTPEQVAELQSGPGKAGVVGLELTRQYYLRVVAARDGSPAAAAGLRTGDYLRAIDDQSTRLLSAWEGQRLLAGEPGTEVRLTVIRGNAAEPHEIVLRRAAPAAAMVTGRLEAPSTAYVRVSALGEGVASELRDVVTRLEREGADRLILDLRGTALGDAEDGVDVARLFVSDGPVTMRRERGREDEPIVASDPAAVTLPTALLISNGTAGAAELVAAALQDHDVATLIGERTLGRVGDQALVPLPNGGGLLMTTVRYTTPEGEAIFGEGVTPDQEVAEPVVEFGATPTDDPILEAARTFLARPAAAAAAAGA